MTVKYKATIYYLDINNHTEFGLNRRFENWC
jgi:hypothetical protein